jgi:hypothetical protein
VKAILLGLGKGNTPAARGLLGWPQTQLADSDGPIVSDDVRQAVQKALEKAGVLAAV